ncbi:MAG TPA: FtsX-like permease family protein [Actinomycetes bacterium]|nr:FtsX-like permease family protein [Actinomycetes bacterium]
MKPAVALGLRLALGTTRADRLRSAMVALSAAIGTLLLLVVAAIARAEQAQHPNLYSSVEMQRLLLAVVLAVALPVLVLAATAGRLSAALRDRRLANLRLLGLSPSRTRAVAVVEAGAAAVAGTAVGLVAFTVARPVLARIDVARRHWAAETLHPHVLDEFAVIIVLPVVVVALAALPHRLDTSSAMRAARKADAKRPSLWRLPPLVAGLALCAVVIARSGQGDPGDDLILSLFAGVGLLGLGTILVVPIFMRVVADLLLRVGGGPATTIAARRLQAQPASVTRVVAGLMIGLFLVTGARWVVGNFEALPQYVGAKRALTVQQQVAVLTTPADRASTQARAEAVAGVRRTVAFSSLMSGCTNTSENCLFALVGTCDDLHALAPELTGCRSDQATWLRPSVADRLDRASAIRWSPSPESDVSLSLPIPAESISGMRDGLLRPLNEGQVFIPRGLPGLDRVLEHSSLDVVAIGYAGQDLPDRLLAAGLNASGGEDFDTYDFVAGLRAMVWAIAAVILSVGLLAFAVAAIDRAVSRRREVVSLQLVGVSPRVLRRTQWIEAALPIVTGSVLAIGTGLLAGATYLSLVEDLDHAPWRQSLGLVAVAANSACIIAGLTVLAASPRIRPDLIRTE